MNQLLANQWDAMLIELRQLLNDGRFVEVLDHIGLLQADEHLFLGNASMAQLLAVKSAALMRLARYDDALDVARQALKQIKHSSDNLLIAELQAVAARALTELGQVAEAERVYRDLIATYRRLDDSLGIIRSLNRLSRVHFIQGQFARSVESLLEAEQYARGLADDKWLASIAGNLGTILNLSGEFHKAIEHLEESVKLNYARGEQSNLCRAYLSLAFAQMHLGRFDDAVAHLASANDLVEQAHDEADRVTLLQYRAQLALLCSNFSGAADLAAAGLELARRIAPHSAEVAQIGRLLAQAHLELDQFDRAHEAATAALATAEQVGERIEIFACRRLLAQIAHQRRERVDIDAELRRCVAGFELIGAQYEAAVTYRVWSQLTREPVLVRDCRAELARIQRVLHLTDAAATALTARRHSSSVPLVGAHPTFAELVREVDAVAPSDLPILLLGPTGVGKDQIAKYVHHHSLRSKGPFVQLNCGAIPVELAESELFGHERGAFTNAVGTKVGLIEAATGGTLFLNEVGELPAALQVKLLSALEEKVFYRIGGTTPRKVDIRIIAATNVDLSEAVRVGRFRSDLFFRLAVMTINVPRLADRGDDAYRLFEFFMQSEGIDLDAIDRDTLRLLRVRLAEYAWPGNVRELKNLIEMYSIVEKRDARAVCARLLAKLESNPETLQRRAHPSGANLADQVEQFERSSIKAALELCGGIIRRAAASLGIPEATLRSKMKKYRISPA